MKDTNKHNAILKLYPNVVMIDGDIAYDKDDNIVEYNDLAVTTESLMMTLRIQRNQLLQQTDWRMTTDYPYNDQSAWATYRTELRDLPSTAEPTLDENGQLTNVVWPTPPSEV